MKRSTILALLVSACGTAYSTPAQYPVTINSRAQTAPPLIAYRANECAYRATFTDGQQTADISAYLPFMAWATNASSAVISTASVSVVSLTTGVVDFVFSPSSVNHSPGRYIYEIGVRSSNGTAKVFRQGIFQIIGSPVGGNASAINWSTNLNWSTIQWAGLPNFITNETDAVALAAIGGSTNALGNAVNARTDAATNALSSALTTRIDNSTNALSDQLLSRLLFIQTNSPTIVWASTNEWWTSSTSNVWTRWTSTPTNYWEVSITGVLYSAFYAPYPLMGDEDQTYAIEGVGTLEILSSGSGYLGGFGLSWPFTDFPITSTRCVDDDNYSIPLCLNPVLYSITNSTTYYLPVTDAAETWSYADMTNWFAEGGTGETWVQSLADSSANTIMNNHTGTADPHPGKYVKLSGGTVTNPVVVGTLTLGGEAKSAWPSGGSSGITLVESATNTVGFTTYLVFTNSTLGGAVSTNFFTRGCVPQTGQTTVYIAGVDDGTFQKGLTLPQPRFAIYGSGAETNQVIDRLSGLIWTRNPSILPITNVLEACHYITNTMNTAGYAGATDWRMPNIRELHSLINYQYVNVAMSNTDGTGQHTEATPFHGLANAEYLSGTTRTGTTNQVLTISIGSGLMSIQTKQANVRFFAVRGP